MKSRSILTTAGILACLACAVPRDTGSGLAPRPAETGRETAEYVPSAAALPATDIYLANVVVGPRGPEFEEVRNVTDRDGYDNQPAFLLDGSGFLFTSGRDPAQTDIYRYDLASQSIARVTRTPASEYSPTPDPDGGFTTVHESADGQPLWRFDLDGTDRGALLPGLQPVGYFTWVNDRLVAAFVFDRTATEDEPGHPNRLVFADRATGEADIVFEPIGRSLQRVPHLGAVSFVDLSDPEQGRIRMIRPGSPEIQDVAKTLPGRQDHAWLPDRSLLMGDGTVLYRWTRDTDWRPVLDLAPFGAGEITRIAVHPRGERIAIVATRPEPANSDD